MKKRVGIVGFGKLGQFLATKVQEDDHMELAFVWNRSPITEELRPAHVPVLEHLDQVPDYPCDLIVEVAHPDITKQWGGRFLEMTDYMVGSPTAFCDDPLREKLINQSQNGSHGLYIPQGAMIGLADLLLAKQKGRVSKLKLTMEKTPDSIKYYGDLEVPLNAIKERRSIYRGPVGPLCEFAPNNVNTMAVATLASGLSFSEVEAELIVDPSLNSHIVRVEVLGPDLKEGQFRLAFEKNNPAAKGAVTGQATYDSFYHSIQKAFKGAAGLHFC